MMASRAVQAVVRRLASLCLILTLAGCGGEVFERPDGPGSWVLVDLFHTDLQNPIDHRLNRGVYAYQGVHGYARLFDHLERHGYPWTATRTMRIDDDLLEGFSVLFVNLLHERKPDFDDREIDAIERFVAGGGGLFVIADHTNVYRHAERLNPLLEPMGVEVRYHSALDSNEHAVSGGAWLEIENLAEHPTNADVRMISFQTGGILRSDGGTAFLSEHGYGDFWDEDTDGFYGNWRFDGDESVEPRGADIPLVAAVEHGAGRVFVVADQNIYGDVWLHYGDNFAHALNGFEWLAQRDGEDEVPLRDRSVPGLDLAVERVRADNALGQPGWDRYYGLFAHLNRHQGVTARATGRLERTRDALMIPTPRATYSEADVEAVQAYLQEGKRVVLLVDLARLTSYAVLLLRALAPDFSFTVDGAPADLEGPPAVVAGRFSGDALPRIEGRRRVTVGPGRCDGYAFRPAALEALEVAGREQAGGEPAHRLLDVRSAWGEPLFAAGGADLARVKRVGSGELVLVLQDNLLRNGTLGGNEAEPPPPGGEHVAELVYGLLDYLRTPVGC